MLGKCLPSGGDDGSDLFVSDMDDGQTSDADSLKSIKDSTCISSLIADLDVSLCMLQMQYTLFNSIP